MDSKWMCSECGTVNKLDTYECECGNKLDVNKTRCRISIEVIEILPGRHKVNVEFDENNCTMKDISLLLYNLKQVEQELIDRKWNGFDEFEINEDDT